MDNRILFFISCLIPYIGLIFVISNYELFFDDFIEWSDWGFIGYIVSFSIIHGTSIALPIIYMAHVLEGVV